MICEFFCMNSVESTDSNKLWNFFCKKDYCVQTRLLCKRPACYLCTTNTQVTEKICKFALINASVIYQILMKVQSQ